MKCLAYKQKTTSSIKKSWKYDMYSVERYVCTNCNETFNLYKLGGEVKFTLPKMR